MVRSLSSNRPLSILLKLVLIAALVPAISILMTTEASAAEESSEAQEQSEAQESEAQEQPVPECREYSISRLRRNLMGNNKTGESSSLVAGDATIGGVPDDACPFPINLSSNELPSGQMEPYDEQILFAYETRTLAGANHQTENTLGNGAQFSVALPPTACQTDLYLGDNVLGDEEGEQAAPHNPSNPDVSEWLLVAYDYKEICDEVPDEVADVEVDKVNDADGDETFTDDETAPAPSSDVPFMVTVTNTGDLAGTVTLTDAYGDTTLTLFGPDADVDTTCLLEGEAFGIDDQLAPGASIICTFTLAGYSPPGGEQLDNVVTATLTPPEGDAVTDEDLSTVRSNEVLGEVEEREPDDEVLDDDEEREPGEASADDEKVLGVVLTADELPAAGLGTSGLGLVALALMLLGGMLLHWSQRRLVRVTR